MKKGYIFDLDGTLLDSSHAWEGVASDYLLMKKKTPRETRRSLNERFEILTLHESSCYLKERYDISETPDEIVAELTSMVADRYEHELVLKEGAYALLHACKANGKQLCLLTATDRKNAINALKHNQIYDVFDHIVSTEDYKLTKRSPEIYEKVLHMMQLNKEDCVVIEDSLHAIIGAKKANLEVYAVYDQGTAADWNEIQQIADESFQELSAITL